MSEEGYFVERDGSGAVTNIFSREQPTAQEFLAFDDPEIVTFLESLTPAPGA